MQYLIFIIKRVVMSICMLYAVDLVVGSTGLMIPINVFSILSVSVLGLPAIIGMVIMQQNM